jgi:hypothetical protein
MATAPLLSKTSEASAPFSNIISVFAPTLKAAANLKYRFQNHLI